jgi:sugar phosphate isomerase/epimerase
MSRLLSVNLSAVGNPNFSDVAASVKKAGFDACFTDWGNREQGELQAKAVKENGLIYQSIHAPFGKVHTLWEEQEAGEEYLQVQLDCLADCHRYGAPIMIVHPNIGMTRHTPTELGLERYARLVKAAEECGVQIAFENVEGMEYLEALMKEFGSSPAVGFCWDTGHEMCYNYSLDMMAKYGDHLIATHLNDNMGMLNPEEMTWHDDAHLMPFDGIADWEGIAARLDRHGYKGTLTFELTTKNKPNRNTHDIYQHLDVNGFYKLAYEKACRVASLLK